MPLRRFAPEVGEGLLTESSVASWNVQLTSRFRTFRLNLAMSAVFLGQEIMNEIFYMHICPCVELKSGEKKNCPLSIFYHVMEMTDDFFAIEWCLSWTARGLPSSSLPQEDGLKLLQMLQNMQTYLTFLVLVLSLLI